MRNVKELFGKHKILLKQFKKNNAKIKQAKKQKRGDILERKRKFGLKTS